jgi:YVTN family beta-propeller protein
MVDQAQGHTVSVINGRTGTVVATIRVGLIPDGVAVNPRTDTAYVVNADDSTVSVIARCQN